MKVTEKKKVKKEKKLKTKLKKERVLIVAQEIKLARLLSGNEKTARDRALKTLKKWILNCFQKGYEFKESDFARIWKGLFFAVWMSDKPLVQEELCENIAGILDLFPPEQLKYGLLLVKVGFHTMASEWYGIDQHRMDKCLMLVRRYLRGSLRLLLRCDWSLESCQMYADTLTGKDGILSVKTPHYARNATSMILHIIDCFLEELSKVSEGNIPEESMAELLRPFCSYICRGESPVICVCARRLMTSLLRQSHQGLIYTHKAHAWMQMGCPPGGPDALVPDSDEEGDDDGDDANDDDDEMENSSSKPLDPRAGRVDVILTPLPVPANHLVSMLSTMIRTTGSKARKRAKLCLERFQQLASNEYPLKVTEVDIEPPLPRGSRTKAAAALQSLEKTIGDEADELALRGLSRKHRKRLLAKSRAGLSIVEDVQKINSANGAWRVESETKSDNSDNKNNHKNSKNRKRKSDAKQDSDAKKRKIEKGSKKEPRLKIKDPTKKLDKLKKSMKNAERIKIELSKKDKIVNGIGKGVSKSQNDKNISQKVINDLEKDNVKNKSKNTEVTIKDAKVTDYLEKSGKSTDLSKQTDNSSNKIKKLENSPKVLRKHKKVTNSLKIIDKTMESPKKLTKNAESLKKPDKITNSLYKPAKIETRSSDVRRKALKTAIANKNENKTKNFQKELSSKSKSCNNTPKKVKFVLKNNSMQGPIDYYKSVKQSPSIPFDSSKVPAKTNLKPSTPSPINPFFKKKLKIK